MESSVIKSVDARMVSVELTGVTTDDVMPVWRAYSMHQTGTLLPERVEMRWENGELVRCAVYGRRMKVDGTAGNNQTSTQFWQYGNRIDNNVMPGWLVSLLFLHAPDAP